MAAFGLGLLADKTAVPALTAALQDADPRVRGRAAEALGLIGDTGSAAAVGQMVSALRQAAGRSRRSAPDEESGRRRRKPTPCGSGCSRSCARRATSRSPRRCRIGPAPSSRLVAGRLRAAADRRSARASGAQAAGEEPGRLHARVCRPRHGRRQGRRRDSAPPLDARAGARKRARHGVGGSRARRRLAARTPTRATTSSQLLSAEKTDPNVRLEAVTALATLKSEAALPYVQELLDRRLAGDARGGGARGRRDRSARASSPCSPAWSRISTGAFAPRLPTRSPTMPPEAAVDRLRAMLDDEDKRVLPSVIDGLARLKAPGIDTVLLAQLKTADIGVRAAAARAIGRAETGRRAGGAPRGVSRRRRPARPTTCATPR